MKTMAKFLFLYLYVNFLLLYSFVSCFDGEKNSTNLVTNHQASTSIPNLDQSIDLENSEIILLNSATQSPLESNEFSSLDSNETSNQIDSNELTLSNALISSNFDTSNELNQSVSNFSFTNSPILIVNNEPTDENLSISNRSKLNPTNHSTRSPLSDTTNQILNTTEIDSSKESCESNRQLKVKVDCRRFLRCIKSKNKYVLRAFICKKDQYFDEKSGSCTKSETECDSKSTKNNTNQSKTNRRTGTKTKQRKRSKTRKTNRSLDNLNNIIRISFDDLDLDDENDYSDLNRYLFNNDKLSSKISSSHIIVITGDEDEESYESHQIHEDSERNENLENHTNEPEKLNSKKTSDQPCDKNNLDNFHQINSNSKEVIVRNLTEVHNHINNTIINILPSPHSKLNDHDLIQKHENENDNSTNSEDGEQLKRVTKNITEINREGNYSEINSHNQMNKGIKTHKNTTVIITEESYDRNDNRVQSNLTTESPTINQKELSTSSSVSSESNSGFQNGKRIIKNVTTIIVEEDEYNQNKFNSNKTKERELPPMTSTSTTPLPTNNESGFQNGKRIVKNVTTIIETDESISNSEQKTNKIDQPEIINQGAKSTNPNNLTTESYKLTSTIAPSDHDQSNGEFQNGKRIVKNVTTIIVEEDEYNQNKFNSNKTKERELPLMTSTSTTPLPTNNESGFQNGKRIIKNITTIIETDESISNNEQKTNKIDQPEIINQGAKSTNPNNLTTESYKVTSTIAPSDHDQSNGEFQNGKRIVKNVTTTIIEEENFDREKKSNIINKETVATSTIKPSDLKESNDFDQYENRIKKVTKNITTTIITEESNSSNHRLDISKDTKHEKIIDGSKNKLDGNRIIKNETTTIITEESSNHRNQFENSDSSIQRPKETPNKVIDQSNDDSSNSGRIVIKNVTTIIVEDTNNGQNQSGNKNITSSPNLPRKNDTNLNNSNSSLKNDQIRLPCDTNLNNLKPIARIIETHHVIKTLFGSNYLNFNNNSFTRKLRKNLTKIIKPDNMDDATSLILDKNVPNYLVNEIHDIEEKVIFDNQVSSTNCCNSTRLPDSMVTRKPIDATSEYTIKPVIFTESTRNDLPLVSTTIKPGIDPHGSLVESTTKSPIINSHDSIVISTQPSSNEHNSFSSTTPDSSLTSSTTDLPSHSKYEPNDYWNPVYYDDYGICKFRGFTIDYFDQECRKFYLCDFDKSTNKYIFQEFICVPGQVFDLERKVCVYESMIQSCTRGFDLNNASLLTDSDDKLNKKNESLNYLSNESTNEKENSSEEYTTKDNGSTEASILFTDSTFSKTQKPVHTRDNFKNERSSSDSSINSLSNSSNSSLNSFSTSSPDLSSSSFNPIKPAIEKLISSESDELVNAGSNSNLIVRVRPMNSFSNNRFNGQINYQNQVQDKMNNQFLSFHQPLPFYSSYYDQHSQPIYLNPQNAYPAAYRPSMIASPDRNFLFSNNNLPFNGFTMRK